MSTNSSIDPQILAKAQTWLSADFDESTQQEVQQMIDGDPVALTDAFYQDLEFGTGGLRGVMGAGTNKMNVYMVGMATQGLANYILNTSNGAPSSVAIAHDSRINSRLFAETAAEVLSANNITVYLFDALRPTPELSFAVRHLACQAGIVVTASHNPKEYNGYKVYWNDGGQLVPPHDKNVIAEVRKITSPAMVNKIARKELIKSIGAQIDQAYYEAVCGLSLSNAGKEDIKVVFTPIHGTGVMGLPQVLKQAGFTQVEVLEAQAQPDGNFPTVHSPNPEEAAALDLAIKRAIETGADLVLGTDPDSDRVGIAARNKEGQMVLMNGNETAAILIAYVLENYQNTKGFKGNEYIAKTIVTTDLLQEIADGFAVKTYECLTGFKYIAEIIKEKENHELYLGGGEESYGYLFGSFVRDKDAISSAMLIAEAAAWAKSNQLTLPEYLQQIHLKHHAYQESLVSITKKGKSGAEEIQQMMESFRTNCPKEINQSKVVLTRDYKSRKEIDLSTNEVRNIELPTSNVFQFILEDQSVITARPSGTEPKIKFYISVRKKVINSADYEQIKKELQQRIELIKTAVLVFA